MPKAAETVEIFMASLLVERKGKVLIQKRSKEERWLKGMWEFPSAEGKNFEEALRKLEKAFKVKARREELKEVRHQITHHRILLRLFPATSIKPTQVPSFAKWVEPKALPGLPFASAQNKLRDWVLPTLLKSQTTIPLRKPK